MRDQSELIRRAQEGDKGALDEMISGNLGLVHSIVRRFEHRGCDREELFQTGCIGLIKAIKHFDLSLQLAFSTYAVPMIMGEIRRFLRDDGMVKVSRTLKEQGYKISKARELLVAELGREPELSEIEALTELTREEIVLAMEANREVESIYQPIAGAEGEELLLLDQLGNSDNPYEEPEKEAVLNELVVKQLLALLEEKDGAFAYAGCDVVDGEGQPISKVRHVPECITYKQLLWGNVIPCLTVVIDRQKTGDFEMLQMGHEDYAAWLTIIKKIPMAYGIDECLATYREHRTSVSANKLKAIRWAYNVYRKSQKLPVYKSVFYLLGHVTQAMRKR